MADYNVVNNEAQQQFEVDLQGEKAYLTYRFYKADVALMHTFVPPPLEGKGVAAALAKTAFAWARANQKLVMIYCPYVAAFVQRHPEYRSYLDPQYLG